MALDTFTLLDLVMKLNATVVLPSSYGGGASADADRIFRVKGWEISEKLRGPDAPTPTPVALLAKEYTLASGEATIDLTAAHIIGAESGGVPAATEDLTGKNLIRWHFSTRRTTGNNAAAITIKPHATNGYDLFGASGLEVLPADSDIMGRVKTGTRDPVAATDKIIHFTGTTGDIIRAILVFEA